MFTLHHNWVRKILFATVSTHSRFGVLFTFLDFQFYRFHCCFFCQWYKTILLGGALLSLRFTLHLWHKRVKVDCLRNCEIGRRPEFGNSIRRRCPCCCLSSRCSRSFALKPPSPASLRHLATGPVLVSWRAENTFYETSFSKIYNRR